MVDEQQPLTWDLATRLLDANFYFRSQVQGAHGRKSYRSTANGPELGIWPKGDKFMVELPRNVFASQAEMPGMQKTARGFEWEIATVGQLLKAMSMLTKAVNSDIQPFGQADTYESIEGMRMAVPLNSILYGPPGTGKTHKTAQLAVEICDGKAPVDRDLLMTRYEKLRREGRISFVTFHQSYGYEDFVEGLRPETNEGQVTYRVRPGVFRDVCDAARRSMLKEPTVFNAPLDVTGTTKAQQTAQDLPFVLIIDEINRANISKVFGELITLLESDKREGQVNALTVKLPYSGDDFCIPANLFIVGTMNTADRSIALLDTALRRRFEFEELQPDYDVLPEENINGIHLRPLLRAINERIEYLYDRNHTIGHAYLLGVRNLTDLEVAFRRKVIPLLLEYFYEDWSKVKAVLNDKDGAFIKAQEKIPRGLEAIVDGYGMKPRYEVNRTPLPPNAFVNIYQDA